MTTNPFVVARLSLILKINGVVMTTFRISLAIFLIFSCFGLLAEPADEEKKRRIAQNTPRNPQTPPNTQTQQTAQPQSQTPPLQTSETPKPEDPPTKDEPAKPDGSPDQTRDREFPKDNKSGALEVRGERGGLGVKYLDDVKGTFIYSGKKNETLELSKMNANFATNNNRQVYAKVPGISVWENDGSGIQTGIATRGLSPNRMWEFNVRQNGYDISSDVFGYPEAYFQPPLEAVDRIEILRGAGALQYGPQFGGLVNYVIKKPNASKPFAVETRQTGGSYNLFNSYNSVSGTSGNISYFTYYHNRSADGWRNNGDYRIQTGYVHVSYKINEKLKLGFEFTKSQYELQQSGGLLDGQFQYDPILTTPNMEVNPRQSNRSRNWFSVPWNIPALTLDYDIDEKTKLTVKAFGLIGERNSVGNVSPINISDVSRQGSSGFTIDQAFSPRRVDRDFYNNAGVEARFAKTYSAFGFENTSSFGVRHFVGNTDRIRNANGSRGINSSLQETNRIGDFVVRNSELKFRSVNYAVFYEHLLKLTEKFSITPGARYEFIQSEVSGHLSTDNLNPALTPVSLDNRTTPFVIARPEKVANRVLLGGIGLQYKWIAETNFYANYTQAYRPVLFQELYTPGNNVDDFDPKLKAQTGYNADLGYRGNVKNYFSFDVGVFQLRYNNRVGTIAGRNRTDLGALQTPTPNLRTNTGDTLSRGVEAFMEYDPISHFVENPLYGTVSGFVSYAQIQAKYVRSSIPISVNTPNGPVLLPDNGSISDLGIVGNRVENAPSEIVRYGLTYTKKGIFSASLQTSQVSSVFTDANNTTSPLLANLNAQGSGFTSLTPNSQVGKINGYQVSDFSFTWNLTEILTLRGGINNLENRVYATRRAGGYPGPGLIPAEGRTAYLGIGAVF